MAIELAPETLSKIATWVETGRYGDANAVIEDALQALRRQEQARFERLRELVLEGHHSPIAGELDEAMWDELERSAEERFLRGERPDPDVCP